MGKRRQLICLAAAAILLTGNDGFFVSISTVLSEPFAALRFVHFRLPAFDVICLRFVPSIGKEDRRRHRASDRHQGAYFVTGSILSICLIACYSYGFGGSATRNLPRLWRALRCFSPVLLWVELVFYGGRTESITETFLNRAILYIFEIFMNYLNWIFKCYRLCL